ncbi:MAG: tRNA pseudouridine(55) synthase TruB [Spirochaetes bacterium GWB1_48_6]|nr:MAG: tRNA pseudouridine(55) synthase TruB [Spirochaetes bacterium GWB1_48_6]
MKSGVVLLNKPAGITSFQALGAVKRALGHGKVGHTGTLDKFATGLMIVLAGKLTRLASMVEAQDKTYTATIKLGEETSTLDPEGDVIKTGSIPPAESWEGTLAQFQGKILQSPPEYSAIHIDGKRAYERVRAGEVLEIKPREITIHDLKILSQAKDTLDIFVHCSKGTYIRSLARDWARAAGTCGHLITLNRLSIGKVDLSRAVDPKIFNPEHHLLNVRDFLPLWGLGEIEISPEFIPDLLSGKTIRSEWFRSPLPMDKERVGVFDEDGNLRALLEKNGTYWGYGFVGA